MVDKDLCKRIWIYTSFLVGAAIKQRIWHIANSTKVVPICMKCSKLVKWDHKANKYRLYCSTRCAHNDQTVKDKTKQTCLIKYGVASSLVDPLIKKRIETTNLRKYGKKNISQTEHFKTKYKQTCLTKYGVENVSKSDAVKAKISETHLKKYGRVRASQSHISNLSYSLKDDFDWLQKQYSSGKSIKEISSELKVGHSQLCMKFKEFGIQLRDRKTSAGQNALQNFISSLNTNLVSNYRYSGKKEVDIYVPSKNIAFEYDGLFWHSEIFKNQNYHFEKKNVCSSKGIHLVQIFESEWIHKNQIVKSRVSNLLGFSKKIYARKCEIVPVISDFDFMNDNHIQGYATSSIRLGLQYDNELVAVMSFGKPRYSRKYQWELIRYSNKCNTTVVGGASKLLASFEKTYTPTSIISYSDRRWNTGNLYKMLGFSLERTNSPGYYYTDFQSLYTRYQFQKSKLEHVLENYSSELSEVENMKNNGFVRLFDSGQDVFVKLCKSRL